MVCALLENIKQASGLQYFTGLFKKNSFRKFQEKIEWDEHDLHNQNITSNILRKKGKIVTQKN